MKVLTQIMTAFFANYFMGMGCWCAAALPLGGYIGYKMGGDRQNLERARRSVTIFWRGMGIGMSLFICVSPLVLLLILNSKRFSSAICLAIAGFWLNVCQPILLFGMVPLSLVVWIWQRSRQTGPPGAVVRPIACRSPGSVAIWAVLATTAAFVYFGFFCWYSSFTSPANFPKRLFLSTSEIQSLIANPQVPKFRFRLYQNTSGARMLTGDLLEGRKMNPFVAPAEQSTLTLLAEKGVSYETTIENRDSTQFKVTLAGWWCLRLLGPLCCFIFVAGAVTLVRENRNRSSRRYSVTNQRNERRVDQSFAALSACGMVALAVFQGANTDWQVRAIPDYQIPAFVAGHKHARFEVFEYWDGSRKLWISDRHHPDFIAAADEATLGVLTRQGVAYQTYTAGMAGLSGSRPFISALWMLALTAGAGCLFWWTAKSRPVSLSRLHGEGTV
jgi:hypothetical protein